MKFNTLQAMSTCFLMMPWVPAHAYLDPGTGSAIIQGVIATVAAVGVARRYYWHQVLAFFSPKKTEESDDSQSESEKV